jgi:coenzyme F420-dependent glucose-6-phosphate dehydrogenase
MLKLGWKAGTEQYSPGELLEYAVLAEQAGFDTISASDHFHPWSEKGEACFVWTWLGAVAARTSKITLGTGVTCPILRYHPAIIAQAAATLASLAPGRVFLGVGTGEALNEYSATAQWPSYKRRQAQMAEAIELIRALWSGKKITHKGTHYQTREAKLYTRHPDPIQVYVSTMVPNSAPFAGKHGDGLITVGGEEPETYRAIFDKFEAGARAAGKNANGAARMIEIGVAYTDNEADAIECKRAYWAGTFVPELFTEKNLYPADVGRKRQAGKLENDHRVALHLSRSGRPCAICPALHRSRLQSNYFPLRRPGSTGLPRKLRPGRTAAVERGDAEGAGRSDCRRDNSSGRWLYRRA